MDEVKRELVREWLLKASRDLTVAKILARSPEAIWEASLYHCQQAAEKALKGFLAYWDRPIEKTHNLVLLLEKASQVEPCLDTWEDAAARLTPFSTAYRYPGSFESPGLEQLNEALDDAESVLDEVRSLLPPEFRPQTGNADDGSNSANESDPEPEI